MRFIVLVKSNEKSEAGVLPDEKMLSEMGRYNDELVKAGMWLSGDGLQASAKGARVRIAGGKTTVIDGPFAEAKELVGGFWLLQAKSKQEAVAWLERAPLREGMVEIRELYAAEDFGGVSAPEPPPVPARKPGTRRYMTLLKADRKTEAGTPPSEVLLSEMGALMEEAAKKGELLAGEGLKPTAKGTRIVYAGDQRTVIDGPFAETKEIVAGFSILQLGSKEEAIEGARRCLEIHVRGIGVEAGEIEVRQLFELEDFPVDPDEKQDGWREQERRLREGIDH